MTITLANIAIDKELELSDTQCNEIEDAIAQILNMPPEEVRFVYYVFLEEMA